MILWLGMHVGILTRIDPTISNMLLSQYLLKRLILNIYFESNYDFIEHLGCHCTRQNDQVILDLLPYGFNFLFY
jgi:hypothetical protein